MVSQNDRQTRFESLFVSATEKLEEKINELSLVRRVSDTLVRAANVNEACERLIEIILNETNCENCSIMLLEGGGFTIRAARGQTDNAFSKQIGKTRFSLGEGIAGQAAATQKCIVIQDTLTDPNFQTRHNQLTDVRSLLCAPLVDRGHSMGVLNLSAPEAGVFDDRQKHIITIIVNQAALLLSNLKLQDKVSGMRREQETLLRHELKNILTPIGGYTQLVLLQGREQFDEKLVAYLERIQTNVDRMDQLIISLKLLQEFEMEQGELNLVEYDLFSVLDTTLLDLQEFASERKVTFKVNTAKVNPMMLLDMTLMPGVIHNLVKNAIEHVSGCKTAAERTIRINMYNGKKSIILCINNKGRVIPPEKLPRFFDKFNSDKTTKKGGTGLGTTYAFDITKAHGGDIYVESTPSEGTTVTVKFPQV